MNLDYYSVFRIHKKSLQHTSRDTAKTPVQFMTLDTRKVVDFDEVKTSVLSNAFCVSNECARSADALLSTAKEEMLMIEFKNGDFSNIEISQKANNSVMLFNYVTGEQIDFTRKNISFVLVYNEDVKKLNYMESIALHKAKLSKDGIRLFGTDDLKGYSYKDVYMIEKKKFDEFIRKF